MLSWRSLHERLDAQQDYRFWSCFAWHLFLGSKIRRFKISNISLVSRRTVDRRILGSGLSLLLTHENQYGLVGWQLCFASKKEKMYQY